MTLLQQVRAALPHITVENHPYDIGYWARIAGIAAPVAKKGREGWTDADRELKRAPGVATDGDGSNGG